MNFDEQLAKALASGDLIAVRATLIAVVEDDKNKSNPQALQKADSSAAQLKFLGVSLFVPDDGCFLSTAQSQWNINFYDQIKAKMYYNFSREKLVLAQDVLIELRRKKETTRPVDFVPTLSPTDDKKKTLINDDTENLCNKRSKTHPIVTTSKSQGSTILLVGGVLFVGGIVVGSIAAGVMGAVIGGGIGIFAASQIPNNKGR